MKRVLALSVLFSVLAATIGCGGGSSAKTETPGPAPVVKGKEVKGLETPVKPKDIE